MIFFWHHHWGFLGSFMGWTWFLLCRQTLTNVSVIFLHKLGYRACTVYFLSLFDPLGEIILNICGLPLSHDTAWTFFLRPSIPFLRPPPDNHQESYLLGSCLDWEVGLLHVTCRFSSAFPRLFALWRCAVGTRWIWHLKVFRLENWTNVPSQHNAQSGY